MTVDIAQVVPSDCRACPERVKQRSRCRPTAHCADGKRCSGCAEQPGLFGYHAKPVKGFGDKKAEVLIIGMAPSFHGANRTGRPFTGDASGEFLFAELHRLGYASKCRSSARGDGLGLKRVYITNAVKCANWDGTVAFKDLERCTKHLASELACLEKNLLFVVALGEVAHNAYLTCLKEHRGAKLTKGDHPFTHKTVHASIDKSPVPLVDCHHPSAQARNANDLEPGYIGEVFLHMQALTGVAISA